MKKDKLNEKLNDSIENNENKENKRNNEKEKTLFHHYIENKNNLIYKRYDEIDLDDPVRINDKIYFATYLSKLKKFIKRKLYEKPEIKAKKEEVLDKE